MGTIGSFTEDDTRAPLDDGCSPPPSCMMPAAMSSWLNLPMASSSSWLGIAPVSEVWVAFTKIMNRMVVGLCGVSRSGVDCLSRQPRSLLSDLRLDEFGQVSQRLLPAEVTGFDWNDIRQAFLHDADFRTERDFLQRHRYSDLTGQVRILELVGVTQALVGDEFDILATERVALAVGEIPKGHPEGAAYFRVHVMHGAGVAIRRKPLGHRVRLEEGAIDLLGLRGQDSMESHGVGHDQSSSCCTVLEITLRSMSTSRRVWAVRA